MGNDFTKKEIRTLWKEAFGDSNDFIDSFIDKFYSLERMYTVWKRDKLISVLHILPFSMNGLKVGYIYGVATDMEERGKGHATRLIKKAITQAKSNNLDAIALIPASESLRCYYEKFGFRGCYPATFSGTGDFDFGTGDCSKDLVAILPLKEVSLPTNGCPVTLEWIG